LYQPAECRLAIHNVGQNAKGRPITAVTVITFDFGGKIAFLIIRINYLRSNSISPLNLVSTRVQIY